MAYAVGKVSLSLLKQRWKKKNHVYNLGRVLVPKVVRLVPPVLGCFVLYFVDYSIIFLHDCEFMCKALVCFLI